MNMTKYSDAISLLPDNYKAKAYADVHEIIFKGRLVIASNNEQPMVFENGKWNEFKYENTLSGA